MRFPNSFYNYFVEEIVLNWYKTFLLWPVSRLLLKLPKGLSRRTVKELDRIHTPTEFYSYPFCKISKEERDSDI